MWAQDSCPLPPSPFNGEANIFSPQQEMYLGEIMEEHEGRYWNLIANDELNARLQRVGEALLKHLPQSDIHYSFRLIDLPEINAFGIPGGRVYVTRKMVAFLKDDNELAALLAHEIGHTYTHQQAIDFTRLLREKLGITKIGDRDDIRRDFNALLDQWNRKRERFDQSRSSKEQIVADQLGLYAMARAGFPPEAMAAFLDRLQETHGDTGSFLSELFRTTPEENHRLRELLKNTRVMPANCIDRSNQFAEDSFGKWQQAVVLFSAERKESSALADALIRKTVLDPPLQDDFLQIRFSPNGKYLLVQDESAVTVLKRDPLSTLFRIPAVDATPADFSPDSTNVVFYSAGLRVETWSVAEQKQTSAHEILERKHCLQSALSPDGKTFACLESDLTMRVLAVDTGTVIYEKKNFAEINWLAILVFISNNGIENLHFVNLKFAPSGKVLIASSSTNTLVLDLATRKTISVPGSMRDRFHYPFTFLTSDRLAMACAPQPGVYEFPSGKLIQAAKLGGRSIERAGHGNAVFLRPLMKHAVGLYDIDRQQIIVSTDKQAIDAYDDIIASEGKDGRLLLSSWRNGTWDVLASTDLPRTELSHLRAVAVSADMNWLAFSLRERGGIYNLSSNQRAMFLRGFRGAWFVSGPALISDYPKNDQLARTIAKLDLQQNTGEGLRTVPEDVSAFQTGPYLVVRKPKKEGGSLYSSVTLEVQDVVTGQTDFSQYFPGAVPSIFLDPRSNMMAMVAGVTHATAENENASEIEAHFSWNDQKRSVYDIQLVDMSAGTKTGALHVDSGKFSFTIRDIAVTRDYLALTDSENRVQLYSVKTGKQIGTVFGGPAYLSTSGLMSVVSQKGKIDLYDCATLQKLNEFEFPAAAIYSQISNDGQRLMVLTADQIAYILKTRAQSQSTQSAVNSVRPTAK